MEDTLPPEVMKGIEAERRFFRIVDAYKEQVPWLLDVQPARFTYDIRGVDAIARIVRRCDHKTIRIPLQIKSSFAGVDYHFMKYPNHWLERIVMVVVGDDVCDGELFRALRNSLYHARTHNYDYENFFDTLDSPLPHNGTIVARMMAYRAYVESAGD